MSGHKPVLLETPRLRVRFAFEGDVEVLYALWTDPRVMIHVGYPRGLPVTPEEILKTLRKSPGSEFDTHLIIEERDSGEPIGECMMLSPNEENIAQTDAKVFPRFWGHRYGVEIQRGLLGYLFKHTKCRAVKSTPNVNNPASVRLQESVGGVRVAEAVYEFPESMRDYTVPVHHYVYHMRRSDWQVCRCRKPRTPPED